MSIQIPRCPSCRSFRIQRTLTNHPTKRGPVVLGYSLPWSVTQDECTTCGHTWNRKESEPAVRLTAG